jgi:hypothetical protein
LFGLPGVALTKNVRATPGYFIEPAPGFFSSERSCAAKKRLCCFEPTCMFNAFSFAVGFFSNEQLCFVVTHSGEENRLNTSETKYLTKVLLILFLLEGQPKSPC